jgi:hypothetical protein
MPQQAAAVSEEAVLVFVTAMMPRYHHYRVDAAPSNCFNIHVVKM